MFSLLNPNKYEQQFTDKETHEIMAKTMEFFENKGLASIKEDDQLSRWYEDFLQFIGKEQIFAKLLTPSGYGDSDSRFDLSRVCRYNEILGFYSFAYQYCYQVTILGLGPIWMGANEAIKHKTAQLLKDGAIFAFGLSEREHGADLYSNEMKLYPNGDGTYRAEGNKYYIGNANKAALVATAGKYSDTGDYVFFVVDSQHRNYKLVKKISTAGGRAAYVGEYELINYPITVDDILSSGPQAWDSSLSTINIGKVQLGWCNIGVCTHALYEAVTHASNRMLYGHPVTDFPHIRKIFSESFARLLGMKFYASRSLDYFRSASDDDRRYLLFNPIQKMMVTTQGMKVVDLLMDVIAAKGYEQDTYFESALRDIGMPARLEGTPHVNIAQIIKFVQNYFFDPVQYPEVNKRDDPADDSYLFRQKTGMVSSVRFPNYQMAYEDLATPNIKVFLQQIDLFRDFFMEVATIEAQRKNADYMLALGEMFTLIVYAQLIVEECKIQSIAEILVDQIFGVLVKDFAKCALTQISNYENSNNQVIYLREMMKTPVIDAANNEEIWTNWIAPLNGAYEMNR
ncbi:MAG: acyl-CoA dehydrogenase [Ignavibacteriales bacterium]